MVTKACVYFAQWLLFNTVSFASLSRCAAGLRYGIVRRESKRLQISFTQQVTRVAINKWQKNKTQIVRD